MKRIAPIALALTLLYPAMMLLYALSPEGAIQTYLKLLWGMKTAGLGSAVGFCALAIVYPPFLEQFRRLRQRIGRRMSADWAEIQRLEKLMADGGTSGLAFKLGNAYFGIEDYKKAAKHFEHAIDQDPDSPVSASYRLGVCCLQLNRPEQALPRLKAAFEQEPNHDAGEVQLQLAHACRLTGDLESARRYYGSYEQYSGGTAELHYGFGLLLDAKGDRAAARARMKQATESYKRVTARLRKFHRLPAAQARWFLLTKW